MRVAGGVGTAHSELSNVSGRSAIVNRLGSSNHNLAFGWVDTNVVLDHEGITR